MTPFIVEGFLGKDTPAIFDVRIGAYSSFETPNSGPGNALVDDFDIKAIIDTGSRQCLIEPGFFKDRHFGSKPLQLEMNGADRAIRLCRGQLMLLTFSAGKCEKTIELPIYKCSSVAAIRCSLVVHY